MYQNNAAAIECILALKILRLSKKDRKWIFKRLPKNQVNILKKRIKGLNISIIGDEFYDEIYEKLNLDFYFQKSEIDEKADALNEMPVSEISKYIDDQPDASLKMMLLCRGKIDWVEHVIPKLKISKDELNVLDNKSRNNKESIVDSTISYLYESLCNQESYK